MYVKDSRPYNMTICFRRKVGENLRQTFMQHYPDFEFFLGSPNVSGVRGLIQTTLFSQTFNKLPATAKILFFICSMLLFFSFGKVFLCSCQCSF